MKKQDLVGSQSWIAGLQEVSMSANTFFRLALLAAVGMATEKCFLVFGKTLLVIECDC